jgi:undecaprenyl-diphosphatase
METISAILLGILQGLTEFLPVSSSGHLVLAREVLPRFTSPPAAFEALLHAGTLLAVVFWFRADLLAMARGCFGPLPPGSTRAREWRLPLLILLASAPAGVVGVVWKDELEALFAAPVVAGAGLLVTAVFLFAAWRWGRGERALGQLRVGDALVIGAFQALAICPGISRSGSTIAAALLMGVAGVAAARFSFLLSLPAVAGAVLLESRAIAGAGGLPVFLLGALAAAAVGYLAIGWMMRLLRTRALLPFALYCAALGSLSLLFLL